eukprot:jgi/Galph1/48/GphlegSOOS_G4824.1
MERLSPLFSITPRTTNREVEHWLNNLNEVDKVIATIEPQIIATNTNWKGIASHNKDTSMELSQVFDKNDPHYEVLLATVNTSKEFSNIQQQFSKDDPVLNEVIDNLRKYREEIQRLRREYKERERLRGRYDHYRTKLENLEKKGKDMERIERNQEKLKDAEDAYESVTQELISKMERCWKKHVRVFAECSICIWNIQVSMYSALNQVMKPLQPYMDQYCQALQVSYEEDTNEQGKENTSTDNTDGHMQRALKGLDLDSSFKAEGNNEANLDDSSAMLDKFEKAADDSTTAQYQTAKSSAV